MQTSLVSIDSVEVAVTLVCEMHKTIPGKTAWRVRYTYKLVATSLA